MTTKGQRIDFSKKIRFTVLRMNNFFSYVFASLPGTPNLLFWRYTLVVFAATFVFGIITAFLARAHAKDSLKRKLWMKYTAWGLTIGPVAYILAFFRFQNAFFLSMRLWIFGWIGISVLWLLFILRYTIFVWPKRLSARERERAFTQYLPQKK